MLVPAFGQMDAVRLEIATGAPVAGAALLDLNTAPEFRTWVTRLASGCSNADEIQAIENFRPVLEKQRLDHASNHRTAVDLSRAISKLFQSSGVAIAGLWARGRGRLGTPEFEEALVQVAPQVALDHACHLAVQGGTATDMDGAFAKAFPLTLRRSSLLSWLLVELAYDLHAASNGGRSETQRPEDATNDAADREYVATAIAGNFEFVSQDARALQLHAVADRAMAACLAAPLSEQEARRTIERSMLRAQEPSPGSVARSRTKMGARP